MGTDGKDSVSIAGIYIKIKTLKYCPVKIIFVGTSNLGLKYKIHVIDQYKQFGLLDFSLRTRKLKYVQH